MLVDTDVLIWNLRGDEKAAERLDGLSTMTISAVTYMELVQGMRNKQELRYLKQALVFWAADIIHINQAVSARASFLVEEHALADSLQRRGRTPRERPGGWPVSAPGRRCASWKGLRPFPARRASPETLTGQLNPSISP